MASTVLPNGIIIPEKYSRDWYNDLYHNWQELDNLLGGGTPKDGTLTIQKNGATVGTFSANQATDETVNITVPTKTSDLTNDSNFVQSSDLATVATSGSYSDLDNKPTIPTVNNATLTIQRNGTTVDTFTANASVDKTINISTTDDTKIPLAGSNAISGSLIPSTDNSIDIGSSTKNLKMLYTKSITIDGAQFSPSDVVHKNGNETKSGELTLSDTLNSSNIVPRSNNTYDFGSVSNLLRNLYTYHGYFRGQQQGDEYSSNARTNLTLTSNRDTLGQSGIIFDSFRENTTQGTGSHILGFGIKENSVRYEGCRLSWLYDNNNNGYIFSLRPTTQGTNRPIKYELGTSAAKWSTINGINPGALSLPGTGVIDISSNITALDGSTINKFTPQVNGWLLINGTGLANDGFIYAVQGRIGMMSANNTSSNRCAVLIPVVAGVEVSVACKLTTLTWANIAPCQGNV